LRVERRLEDDVEQVERRKVRQVAAQEREPLLGAPDRAMALEQALRDEREISRVLLLDALPGLDGADVIARGGRDVAQDDVGADALAVRGEGRHRKCVDRKSTRLNSSHRTISYAVFCLKKK